MPVRLTSTPYEKVWGSPDTEPWYPNPQNLDIGEVWFDARSVPLLVKLLFTSGKLSVQVHPNDGYAKEHHNSPGKTEMWHILRAEPGATIALGLREPITPERLRAASESGEIMELLDWVPVQAGDTFFVPAGTIHAIGEGIALCEVQQISDITYRLYDYGRDRELHLDHGVKVSDLEPREGLIKPELRVECDYFHSSRLGVNGTRLLSAPAQDTLYVALQGEGLFAGQPFRAGEAWEVERGCEPFDIQAQEATFLVTAKPATEPSR